MRQNYLLATAAVAILGAGAFFGLRAQNSERELSDVEVANIEALADVETWVGMGEYDKNCLPDPEYDCVRSPFEVHKDNKGDEHITENDYLPKP